MKFLLAFTMLFSSAAFGSGTLSVEPRYNPETERTYLISGLGIYEKLFWGMAYNSWTGYGDGASEGASEYEEWLVSKHQIDLRIKNFTASPGIRFFYMPDGSDDIQSEYFMKLSYRVW